MVLGSREWLTLSDTASLVQTQKNTARLSARRKNPVAAECQPQAGGH